MSSAHNNNNNNTNGPKTSLAHQGDRDLGEAIATAKRLRDQLVDSGRRIVFAESCTAGGISATLARLPGISSSLCGGFVVYRNSSKEGWLNVPRALLNDAKQGPVSMAASQALAKSALDRTPEADCALAITGDFGPGAPAKTDGHIFLFWVDRQDQTEEQMIRLSNPAPTSDEDIAARSRRLEEAICHALEFATAQAAIP
ncbi:MAG: CinA family protein [Aureliella sp.]